VDDPAPASPNLTGDIPPEDEPAILDLSVLDGFKDYQQPGEPDFVDKILHLFVEDTALRLKALRKAFAENDLAGMKQETHKIKGASGNIGAHRMAALTRELEEKFDIVEEAAVLLSQLEDGFKKVMEVLDSMRHPEAV
jgi:HPt (histidine-containing phosphotransfer) domain-containing protein